MKPFDGFQKNMRFTPIPNVFFTQIMPSIDSIAELKAVLYIFWKLYQKQGYPKYITDSELLSDKVLIQSLGNIEEVRRACEQAVERGILISTSVNSEGKEFTLFLLNTEEDREACSRIESGELDLGALPYKETYERKVEAPNIFELYERNIGMLTPMIGEELKDAESIYPLSWIEEAFKEAVSQNKRSWKYIEAILKRWSSEGKGHGETGRYTKQDPDKYVKGKYGHVVKR